MFDPFSDDPRLSVQRVQLALTSTASSPTQSAVLLVGGAGGQVLAFAFSPAQQTLMLVPAAQFQPLPPTGYTVQYIITPQ